MNTMVNIIPAGSCPNCGHSKFVVFESAQSAYSTNRDGEIVGSKELSYKAVGKCLNCGKEFDMLPTQIRFIPMTRLRKILYDYTDHSTLDQIESYEEIDNPMMKKRDEK